MLTFFHCCSIVLIFRVTDEAQGKNLKYALFVIFDFQKVSKTLIINNYFTDIVFFYF